MPASHAVPASLISHPHIRTALSQRAWIRLALLWLVAAVMLWFAYSGFEGGGADDQRYLEAVRGWLAHFPYVGPNHWSLRHPLVLPLTVVTALFGESRHVLLWVPMAYFLGLLTVSYLAMARLFSDRAALIWAVLFLTTPLFTEMGTEIYPEIVELFWTSSAIFLYFLGRETENPRHRLGFLLASGLSVSLAMLTRETSFFLPILFGALFLLGPAERRHAVLIVAAGALPLVAIETAWLWHATGDIFYRFRTDLHHVDIPSTDMVGRTFHGRVLFNPALGQLWTHDGPFNVHWTVNPVLNLFASHAFVAIFPLLLISLPFWPTVHGRMPAMMRHRVVFLAAAGLLAFVFVNYVLMVSQRQRYYVFTAWSVSILLALFADQLMMRRAWRAPIIGLLALMAAGWWIETDLRTPSDWLATAAKPLAMRIDRPTAVQHYAWSRLEFPLQEWSKYPLVHEGLPKAGEPYLRVWRQGWRLPKGTIAASPVQRPVLHRLAQRLAPVLGKESTIVRWGSRPWPIVLLQQAEAAPTGT